MTFYDELQLQMLRVAYRQRRMPDVLTRREDLARFETYSIVMRLIGHTVTSKGYDRINYIQIDEDIILDDESGIDLIYERMESLR